MSEYAKLHNVTIGNICRRIDKGHFKSAVRIDGHWKLESGEIPEGGFRAKYHTDEERKRGKREADKRWVAEHKEAFKASYHKYLRENKEKVKQSNRRNYLKRKYANAPEEDLVTVAEYSRLHRISDRAVHKHIEQGTAYSARQVNGIWMISRKEIFNGTPQHVMRICQKCGKKFWGFPNSRYCETCRKK